MKNRFIIDWLSFSTKNYRLEEMITMLGLKVSFQRMKGMHGYKDRLYYESISIHYNGSVDQGIWVEMTGKGCRAFESFGSGDYDFIFNMALEDEIKITRLDIAYDDFEGVLDMSRICKDTINQNYISKWKSFEVIYSSGGNSVLLGSRHSDILLRIYDKKAEQKVKDIPQWVRAELQMRDDRALGFIRAYKLGLMDLGHIYLSVINNYLRYVTPTNDSNNRRWPNTDYWDNFISDAEKISIYDKPGTEYTLDCLYDFVIRQCGNSIDAFLKIQGVSSLVEELKERGTRPNAKYIKLIEEYDYIVNGVIA